jgi:hypothetical protein
MRTFAIALVMTAVFTAVIGFAVSGQEIAKGNEGSQAAICLLAVVGGALAVAGFALKATKMLKDIFVAAEKHGATTLGDILTLSDETCKDIEKEVFGKK